MSDRLGEAEAIKAATAALLPLLVPNPARYDKERAYVVSRATAAVAAAYPVIEAAIRQQIAAEAALHSDRESCFSSAAEVWEALDGIQRRQDERGLA